MLFSSWQFALFFALVFTAYLALKRWLKLQNALLLVASYVFYGWWDWRFLGLILFSTGIDYFAARKISVSEDA